MTAGLTGTIACLQVPRKFEMRNGIPTYDRDGPDIAEASGSDAKRFSKGKMLDAIPVNNTSANMLPYYNSSNRIHISNRKHIVANVRNSLDIAKALRQDSPVR